MLIINSRTFRDNQKKYFDLADKNEQIIIKRAKRSYKLVPISEDDVMLTIPPEFRCDPYDVSPSGDMYWADKRNVEALQRAIEAPMTGSIVLKNKEDIKKFMGGF